MKLVKQEDENGSTYIDMDKKFRYVKDEDVVSL